MRKLLAASLLIAYVIVLAGCSKGISEPGHTVAFDPSKDEPTIMGGPKKGKPKSDFTSPTEPAGGHKPPAPGGK